MINRKHNLRNFYRSALYLSLSIFFFFAEIPVGNAKVVDKIVAVVNTDVITQSELDSEADEHYKAMVKSGNLDALESRESVKERTLNSLIDRHLLDQKAKEMEVSVSKDEIDRAMQESIDHSGVPRDVFFQKMKEAGFSEKSYRANLRASILQSKLLSIDVRSKIVITDQMVQDYFQKNYTSQSNAEEYHILQMGFEWGNQAKDTNRDKKTAEKMAHAARAEVLGGRDFSEIAKERSDLPSASDGGDIGTFTLEEMASAMADVIRGLKKGQTSPIIETSDGYQFFQVSSISEGTIKTTDDFDNVKDTIRETLYQDQLKKAYKDWITKLKASAYIKKL